jgi:hypothetical protein
MSPLTKRRMLAAGGLANNVPMTCSSASPMLPTGIVAMTISLAV